MKIPADKVAHIESAIRAALGARDINAIAETYRAENRTPMRFRWDWLWATKQSTWISDEIYKACNANDSHIDTALRQIMKRLGCNWAATV